MVAENSARLVLNIHKGKAKVLKINAAANLSTSIRIRVVNTAVKPVLLYGAETWRTTMTWPFSQTSSNGCKKRPCMVAENSTRLVLNFHKGKAKVLKINAAANLSTSIKIRILNTTVKPVLLYGAETWRTTQQMQEKTSMVAENSARLVLNIHKGKTKVLKINAAAMLEGEALEEMENFTYLGSIVDKQGNWAGANLSTTFLQLKKILAAANQNTSIKIRIFNTTVKPVLLYGAET
nr:hypothetical protein BaRGS_026229 [Batillaria attramentaria]